MRIGVFGFLHESNTFIDTPTTRRQFEQDVLLDGSEMLRFFQETHHELGGFLAGLAAAEEEVEVVPLGAARAYPSGRVDAAMWSELQRRWADALQAAGRLDGLLAAVHGATVAEGVDDADGACLRQLRAALPTQPIVATLDAHANLSPAMVAVVDAFVAYRSNPHLDQRARGLEAADLLLRAVRGEVRPLMAAECLPLIVNIERQATSESHWQPLHALAERWRQHPRMLSVSLVLGFPYADVPEMGSSVIAVADGDEELANRATAELASAIWSHREDWLGQGLAIEEAVRLGMQRGTRTCLLDMGDNVGGGSPGDGTALARELQRQAALPSLVSLFDPLTVAAAEAAGEGGTIDAAVGGTSHPSYGPPLDGRFHVRRLSDGRFRDAAVRHGGFTQYDQGRTAVLEAAGHPTLLVTSRRLPPFSCGQLTCCGLEPHDFRILVAKGVHAPIAAYSEHCDQLLRVNTPGLTAADLDTLAYRHRRRPMFPFERDTEWRARAGTQG